MIAVEGRTRADEGGTQDWWADLHGEILDSPVRAPVFAFRLRVGDPYRMAYAYGVAVMEDLRYGEILNKGVHPEGRVMAREASYRELV